MSDEPPIRIYVGLFYLSSAEIVVHKSASIRKRDVVDGAIEYLGRLNLVDRDYSKFLEQGFQEWNGEELMHSQTDTGQIILFSTVLEEDSALFD